MQQVEKIVLVVALVLLIAGAGLLAFFFPSRDEISKGMSPKVPIKNVEPLDASAIGSVAEAWLNPPKWKLPASGHQLFTSEPFLLMPDGKVIPARPESIVTPGGITLGWAEKYSLDFKSGRLDLEDPDHDGFYNLLEFEAKTDPRNPENHPPFISRLRLEGVTEIPFSITFNSVNEIDNERVFFLTVTDDQKRTRQEPIKKSMPEAEQRKKLGGYILGEYREKRETRIDPATNSPREFDDSELDLLQPEIGRKVTLVLRKPTPSPDSTADFIMLMPGKLNDLIQVKRADKFSLPQEPGVEYLLLDAVANQGAQIRNVATKEEISIAVATPEEKEKVPAPVGEAEETAGGKRGADASN